MLLKAVRDLSFGDDAGHGSQPKRRKTSHANSQLWRENAPIKVLLCPSEAGAGRCNVLACRWDQEVLLLNWKQGPTRTLWNLAGMKSYTREGRVPCNEMVMFFPKQLLLRLARQSVCWWCWSLLHLGFFFPSFSQ